MIITTTIQTLFIRTGKIASAGLRARRILQTFVPTFTIIRSFFWVRTFASGVIKYLSFHASKLPDIFSKITNYKFLTTGRMRKAWMGQFLPMRSKLILFWTEKALDALWFFFDFTFFGVGRTLFRSYASALGSSKMRLVAQGSSCAFPYTQL